MKILGKFDNWEEVKKEIDSCDVFFEHFTKASKSWNETLIDETKRIKEASQHGFFSSSEKEKQRQEQVSQEWLDWCQNRVESNKEAAQNMVKYKGFLSYFYENRPK